MNDTSDYSSSKSPFDLKDFNLDCQAIFEKENIISSLETNIYDKEYFTFNIILLLITSVLFLSGMILVIGPSHFMLGLISLFSAMSISLFEKTLTQKMTLLFDELPFCKKKKLNIKEQIYSINQEILDKKNNLRQFFTPELKTLLDKILVNNQPDLNHEQIISYAQHYHNLKMAWNTEDYTLILSSIEKLFDIIKMTTQQTFSADINLIEKIKTLL